MHNTHRFFVASFVTSFVDIDDARDKAYDKVDLVKMMMKPPLPRTPNSEP